MRRAILPMACAALLAGGCGSAASPQAASTAASPAAVAPQRTAAPTSHLTIETTPRFASPSPSAPVRSGLVRINYKMFGIVPDVVRVRAGSTLEWTNQDPGPEDVTSRGGPQSFASPNLGEGQTFKLRLTRPGIYHYESTLHAATVNGTIEVLR